MEDAISIGPRLRELRLNRGMSQEDLASRAGVSISLISKLERGGRKTARLTSIMKLARALDEDPGSLTGKTNRLERLGDNGVLQVRDAITSPALLPGIDSDDTGEPSDPADLWKAVQRAYGMYFAGEFGVLANTLPGLLAECRLTQAALGAGPVAAAYSHAYQLAACLMVHVGRDDAALIGAERGIAAAAEGDDPYRHATLRGTYVWVLLHMGRYREAEHLALAAASEIEPSFASGDPKQLTAWGGQMLHAAVVAGADLRADDALEYLAQARAGAARMGADKHHYWVSFGPSSVALQEAHIYTGLDEPELVLKASGKVVPDSHFPISYARHSLNEAQALERTRRVDEAIEVAAGAYATSPEWFRHQRFAGSVVQDLVERKTRLPKTLRTMAAAVSPE